MKAEIELFPFSRPVRKGGVEVHHDKKTLLIFQLFLAIFTIYALLDHTGNYHLLVPFFCLTGMFFVGRHEVAFKKI